MKDFIGAFQAGSKVLASKTDQEYKTAQTEATKAKTARDNDPDTLELQSQQARATLASTQDQLKNNAASRAHQAESLAIQRENAAANRLYTQQRGTYLEKQGAAMDAARQPQPSGLLPPGQSGALPVGSSTLNTEVDAYADGGLVSDDDEDDADPAGAGAIPTDVPMDAPTDVSARARTQPAQRGLEGVISPQLVHDATVAGMTWGAKAYGLTGNGAIRTPSSQARAQQFAAGHGGLSDAEMQAARAAVDPEGKLTDSQRNMAALGSVYQFWANKGDDEKASKVAFQMLQHYRAATQRYAAIAAHAAESGNVDLATKAALKAYANVPDGRDIHIAPNPDDPKQLVYYYTDDKGNEIAKGIATPQQLAASAMGLVTGGFDKAILSAAGAREEAAKPKGAVKAQTATDRTNEAKLPEDTINAMKEKWQAANKDKQPDDEFWGQLKDATQHVLQQNPKTTANEAAKAAMSLLAPGKADPEKPDFKILPGGEDGGPHTVKFNSGLKIQLDDDQLETVMNARAARVKAATDKINADMEESDKPGFLEKAGAGAQKVGRGVLDIAEAIPGAAQTAIDAPGNAAIAVGKTIGSLGSRLGSALYQGEERGIGAIPVDDGN